MCCCLLVSARGGDPQRSTRAPVFVHAGDRPVLISSPGPSPRLPSAERSLFKGNPPTCSLPRRCVLQPCLLIRIQFEVVVEIEGMSARFLECLFILIYSYLLTYYCYLIFLGFLVMLDVSNEFSNVLNRFSCQYGAWSVL